EASRASRWVTYPHRCRGPHHIDDCPDQRARCEILPRTRFDVLGVLSEQPFVGVTLHVRVERHPLLTVDQVGDQPLQLLRVLYLVLCLPEDNAERPWQLSVFG